MAEITNDLIWDVMDQLQRVRQMLAALCVKAGIDPAEAGRLPGEPRKAETVSTGPAL